MLTVGVRSNDPDGDDPGQHVTMVDLDSLNATGLRQHIAATLDANDWWLAWVIRSQKGYHVIFPHPTTWATSLAVHRTFDAWDADDGHRRCSITRRAWVLRITRRTNDDLSHVATIERPRTGALVSRAHVAVYASLGARMPADLDEHLTESRTVVLESW